ncbi:hypothetical protein LY78DRAFT_579975, partial [Colletotrichum sublineola]
SSISDFFDEAESCIWMGGKPGEISSDSGGNGLMMVRRMRICAVRQCGFNNRHLTN